MPGFSWFSYCTSSDNIDTENSILNMIKSNPTLDCNYNFPINLVKNGIPFGAKTKEQIGTHCGGCTLISNILHVLLFNKFEKPELIVRVR